MDNTNLSFQEKFLIDNNKEERRKEGQFFTPESCADRLLDIIEQNCLKIKNTTFKWEIKM